MTIRTPSYLKQKFENNDVPQQADYSDIFDSFLPISSSGKQSLDISLNISGDFTASGNLYGANVFTNIINAQQVSASVGIFDRINTNIISASGAEFNLINTQFVSASAATIKYLAGSVDSSVAALGTNTAAARSVTESISIIKAVTSGSQEGVIISRARPGFVQYIINDASASAKVYPTSASKFNQLANGAVYDLPDRTTLMVHHITSAQYYTAKLSR